MYIEPRGVRTELSLSGVINSSPLRADRYLGPLGDSFSYLPVSRWTWSAYQGCHPAPPLPLLSHLCSHCCSCAWLGSVLPPSSLSSLPPARLPCPSRPRVPVSRGGRCGASQVRQQPLPCARRWLHVAFWTGASGSSEDAVTGVFSPVWATLIACWIKSHPRARPAAGPASERVNHPP